ncbi:MAG TPA: PilZ domain-containing protein [Myxococcota bacterium]|nr:PilZ domain-containing protein [Myxococcota bacterium]
MAEPTHRRERGAKTARTQNKAADFAWLYAQPVAVADAEAEGEGDSDKPLHLRLGPEAVLCDSGELDDVAALLYRLGEPPMRVWPADLSLLEAWELPGRLFVTTVRLGLTATLPAGLARPGVVRVAVGDGDAATATTAMLQRGFHCVVRRPVHPEALRLLFTQILFRGRDQRRASRFSYGAEVRWRAGLRSGRSHLAEISSEGCRLLLREPLRVGSRIVLRVPIERGGESHVKLPGRVVRRDLPRRELGGSPASVAISFERLSRRTRANLDLVLASCATGPATNRGDLVHRLTVEQAPSHTPLPVRLAARGLESAQSPAAPRTPQSAESEGTPPGPGYDRRLAPRVALDREVVAIDPGESRVTHTLVGRDLSMGGMSVEPHPLLKPGEKLHVALYGPDLGEPVVVLARVVRTDGTRGFGLRFESLPAESSKRLASLVAALPSVESLSEDRTHAQGVVLGEIVLKKMKASQARP